MLPHSKILVIDDEPDILELIRYNLTKAGFLVDCASSGEEGLKLARTLSYSLIILDLMLPGIEGLDIVKLLKTDDSTKKILIIIISAKGEESDVVKGLELGADDYLTKPFSPKVLVARINTILRRQENLLSALNNEEGQGSILNVGDIRIHPRRHEVYVRDKYIELTSTEFKILQLLIRKAGWVYTREQIVDEVHGEDYPVTDRSIDVQIVGLRKKLGDQGKNIETVRGVGYRFRDFSYSISVE